MDGTLIDTEPYWMAAETDLARRFGIDWTYEDGITLVGNPLDASAQILIDRGVQLESHEVVSTLVARVSERARDYMPWMADARTLLDQVVAAGVPCALVTMSVGALVEAFLEAAGDVFTAVVTGDQVQSWQARSGGVSHGGPAVRAWIRASASPSRTRPQDCAAHTPLVRSPWVCADTCSCRRCRPYRA